ESCVSLEHSFYAVYGVELADADWLVVSEGLEDAGDEDVGLFIVAGSGGPDRVVIGLAHEELPPGVCRSVRGLTPPSPERDEALRAAAAILGYRALAEPGWLLVHDWS
ncbi:hypothetical protein ABZ070_37050, partial [Streptomyces sp. NPDC006283]|uniref:hypothetical protein n=1 Tax=Streptomyces sp. NPDC006283 TaxID=3156741 RepID=UPI0033B1B0F1